MVRTNQEYRLAPQESSDPNCNTLFSAKKKSDFLASWAAGPSLSSLLSLPPTQSGPSPPLLSFPALDRRARFLPRPAPPPPAPAPSPPSLTPSATPSLFRRRRLRSPRSVPPPSPPSTPRASPSLPRPPPPPAPHPAALVAPVRVRRPAPVF